MQNAILSQPQAENVQSKRNRLLCPICGKHTILWLLPTTEIRDLPVKCKRCGKESIVNVAPMENR